LLDQFHAGGTEAVERLLPSLHLSSGMTVLDVGSGFGGPARQVARAAGCSVVGVDITAAYVEAARALSPASDRVEFVCSDVASLDRDGFDAAYTMHVQMNVEDKKTFFTDVAARLRPGARFAVFEVCRSGDGELPLPLPWSLDGTDSFLDRSDDLRATIEGSGFDLVEWVDETAWIGEWFEQVPARMAASGGATLPAILDDGVTRMLNYAVALATGDVSVHRGAFTRR
jgi:SAM-dependent methyltransferase